MQKNKGLYPYRAVGGYYIDFNINREEAASYGLTTGDIKDIIANCRGKTL